MADEQKLPCIIWVHGMGDKPDGTVAPIHLRGDLEREATWTPLGEAMWLPISEDAYRVAIWSDIREGCRRLVPAEPAGAPEAAFERPRPEVFRLLTPRQRAAVDFAYVRAPAGDEAEPQPTASLTQQRPKRSYKAESRRLTWTLLRDYLGRPHVLAYTALAAMAGWISTLKRTMNVPLAIAIGKALGTLLQDLYPYVTLPRAQCRDRIIERVIKELDRAYADGKEICLISQSMGTIVALDALYQWQTSQPNGKVRTFVTLACPLGMNRIKNYVWPRGIEVLNAEGEYVVSHEVPDFPSNVGQWFNLYDRWDYTTIIDSELADNFPEIRPAEGRDRPYRIARIVDIATRRNANRDLLIEPHDWYGFLSSPQLADIVCHFWLGATMKGDAAGLEMVEGPPEHLINLGRSGGRIGEEDDVAPPEPTGRSSGEPAGHTAPVAHAGEHTNGEAGSG